ncbi:MAG: DNA polymerase domain-containing protein, partial [Terriglobales bacterium]
MGKREVRRPAWRGSGSQRRDAARRRQPGARLLGPLPLPSEAESGTVPVDGTPVALSHLGKIYFPAQPAAAALRKRDLLDYTHDVAEFLLPHLLDRPYTLKRYPEGIGGDFFFQKEAGSAMPAWVPTQAMPSEGERRRINFVLCNDCATLLYLVNLGCIDHNAWISRARTPEAPDFILLDLDPGPRAGFDRVVRVARELGRILEAAGILGLPKTSGATGMHIFVPLAAGCTFAQSSRFAEMLFRQVAARLPEITTGAWAVARRPADRVFLDWRQNGKGKTVPPPYSPRPRPGAPVSTPLRWAEVRPGLDPGQFTVRTVRRRLERWGDLFAAALPASGKGQRLAVMLAQLERAHLAR